MPTKLSIFNDALGILAQPALANPDVEHEHGRQLRRAWEPSVYACYEEGTFNHTVRRAELSRLGPTPAWGYAYYYQLPTDFRRVAEISPSGQVNDPLIHYEIEDIGLATSAETVFLKYVSDELLTLTPGEWSQTFSDFVSAELAVRVAPKVNAANLELAMATRKRKKALALGIDAIQNPPAPRRPGSWSQAVLGRGRTNQEQRW